MLKRRSLQAATLAVAVIGLAACSGGGDSGGAAGPSAATAPVTGVAAVATSRPAPASTTTQLPPTTQAPTTTTPAPPPTTTTPAPPATTNPPVLVPLLPEPTCPGEGTTGSSPDTAAPLVCVEYVGSLRWAAVVQTDLGDQARQALTGCAGELTATLTAMSAGGRGALPNCDAAASAVATAGREPYVALVQAHLATCREPLTKYAAAQAQGISYDHAAAETLVNTIFACRTVIEGFANTRPDQ
jgi:hypothetical protein